MSSLAQKKTSTDIALHSVQSKFNNLVAKKNNNLIYEDEAGFAKQLIEANQMTYNIALNNTESLKRAIINVASIGLTLNKALAYAYLVPRDGGICLDVSYKGLVKLATDSGSIKWAKAELVYANDDFEYKGVCDKPNHIANVFGDRGVIVGVYCIAKTCDNDYLVDTMSVNDINEVRNTSKSAKSKYSPWINFYGEMAKKTIIKRASKSWTKTERNNLSEAIEIINQHEGLEDKQINTNDFLVSNEMQATFDNLLDKSSDLDWYLFLETVNGDKFIQLLKSIKFDKTKVKNKIHDCNSKGRAIFTEIYDEWIKAINNDDELGQKELEDFGLFQEKGLKLLKSRKEAMNE